ncbi:MAG: tRNA (pseudouridine(54)-N(1))-methyltransferase TrmY [Nanoarchaeota archaeon]
MREFIYFSNHARTSGNFQTDDLMKAGRMDIAIHTLISAFFLSHDMRGDVKLHLIFYGQPDPPKHIEIQVTPELEISKKDVAGLIKRILYKYKSGTKNEVFPRCFIEKKSFLKVIEELVKENKEIFILDKNGEDVREIELPKDKDVVFILGDQDGLPKKELKRLQKFLRKISVGPKTYFASQVVTIINNELDRRGV